MPKVHQQSGIALIIFLIFLVLGATAILLSDFNNSSAQFRLEDQAQTAQALAQAKDALLGFAMTYAKTHPGQSQGYLPCPDQTGDGSADTIGTLCCYSDATGTSCQSTTESIIGRFPWRTLGLPPLRDGSGECLWYAVSGRYKDHHKQPLTSDTNGSFIVENTSGQQIAGTTLTDQAIAILFAPGRPLKRQDAKKQNRATTGSTECGGNAQVSDYLDMLQGIDNAQVLNDNKTLATSSMFINAPPIKTNSDPTKEIVFNDTLMLITPKDFMPVYTQMDLWVAQQVTKCIRNYSNQNTDNYFEKYKAAVGDLSSLSPGEMTALVNGTLNILPPDTYRRVYQKEINLYVNLMEARFIGQQKSKNGGTEPVLDDIDAERMRAMETAIGIDVKFSWATPMDDPTYTADESGLRFGRIPDAPFDTTSPNTHDYMQNTWTSSCFDQWWWDKWKEMVFYAVDDGYTPDTTTYIWVKTLYLGSNTTWIAWLTTPFDDVTSTDWDRIETITGKTMADINSTQSKSTSAKMTSETDWIAEPKDLPDDFQLRLGHRVSDNPEEFEFNNAQFVVLVAGRRLLLNNGNINSLSAAFSKYPQYQQSRESLADKQRLRNYLEGQAKPLNPLPINPLDEGRLNDPVPVPEKWRRVNQGGNFPGNGETDRIDKTHSGDEIFIRKPIISGYFNDIGCKNWRSDCEIPEYSDPK